MAYIKAPVGPDGIVVMRGKAEKVGSRAEATEMVYGDADFLRGQAEQAWPDLDWRTEKVGEKYIVTGAERLRPRR